MILTIGQKVWAPKVAGVPAHKPQNNIYELVGPLEEEEGSVGGYQLKHGEHVFFAKQGTVKHLQDVKVCIKCGSDKLQIPSWVDNLGNVLKEMDAEDPWCPVCEKILTRSFHCTLDEYLKLKDVVKQQIHKEFKKWHEELRGVTILPKEEQLKPEIDWKNMSFEEWEERCSADVDARFWHSEIYTHRCYENMKAGLEVKLPGNPIPGSKFYIDK